MHATSCFFGIQILLNSIWPGLCPRPHWRRLHCCLIPINCCRNILQKSSTSKVTEEWVLWTSF